MSVSPSLDGAAQLLLDAWLSGDGVAVVVDVVGGETAEVDGVELAPGLCVGVLPISQSSRADVNPPSSVGSWRAASADPSSATRICICESVRFEFIHEVQQPQTSGVLSGTAEVSLPSAPGNRLDAPSCSQSARTVATAESAG
jgi:hypothetical protein